MKAELYKSDDDSVHQVWIICPGCNSYHAFTVKSPGFVPWQWNGSLEKPTFTPSLLVNMDHPETRCHSYVTDGNIQFLSDCWHELKNQTIELPDIQHFFTSNTNNMEQQNEAQQNEQQQDQQTNKNQQQQNENDPAYMDNSNKTIADQQQEERLSLKITLEADDVCTPYALEGYADALAKHGCDPEIAVRVREISNRIIAYQQKYGSAIPSLQD